MAAVEFEIRGRSGAVVAFTSVQLMPDAIEIKKPEDFPKQWAEGHEWAELTILPEAYLERERKGWVPNFRRLLIFIRAFGFEKDDPLYMHVWRSNLP